VLALEVPPLVVILTPARLLFVPVVNICIVRLTMAHLPVMVIHVLGVLLLLLSLGHRLVVVLTVRRLLIIGGRRLVLLLVVHLLLHLHLRVHGGATLLIHVRVGSVVTRAGSCVHLAVSLLLHDDCIFGGVSYVYMLNGINRSDFLFIIIIAF